jgi:hypothetical protein
LVATLNVAGVLFGKDGAFQFLKPINFIIIIIIIVVVVAAIIIVVVVVIIIIIIIIIRDVIAQSV